MKINRELPYAARRNRTKRRRTETLPLSNCQSSHSQTRHFPGEMRDERGERKIPELGCPREFTSREI